MSNLSDLKSRRSSCTSRLRAFCSFTPPEKTVKKGTVRMNTVDKVLRDVLFAAPLSVFLSCPSVQWHLFVIETLCKGSVQASEILTHQFTPCRKRRELVLRPWHLFFCRVQLSAFVVKHNMFGKSRRSCAVWFSEREPTLADRGAVGRLVTGLKSGVVAVAEDYKAAKEHL